MVLLVLLCLCSAGVCVTRPLSITLNAFMALSDEVSVNVHHLQKREKQYHMCVVLLTTFTSVALMMCQICLGFQQHHDTDRSSGCPGA